MSWGISAVFENLALVGATGAVGRIVRRLLEERDFPYKQTQYQQSLLQGLPLAAQSYSYAKPSQLSELLGGSGGLMGLLQSFGIIPSDVEEGTP